MKETVRAENGVGLAAPQIGKSLRIIILNLPQTPPVAMINPKILNYSWRKEIAEEGCLSIPLTFGNVKRSKIIKVKAFDEKGTCAEFKISGFAARVIQHEVDHLNGILFTDKAKKIFKND